MEGISKGDEETGFAALFNEFVSKVNPEAKDSPEVKETNPDYEDDKKKDAEEKKKDEKQSVEVESGLSGSKAEGAPSEDVSDVKTESSEPKKDAKTSDKEDKEQISSKLSPAVDSEVTEVAAGSEENVVPDSNMEKSKEILRSISSRESSPHSVLQESSPMPSNSDSSFQTSPASSTLSSTIPTPASSPLTTLQARSTVLSAASAKLTSSTSRRLPSKVEKPVLRDRAGKKRYNSLESEFVVDFDKKRERSKSGVASQGSRRRQSRGEREGPRYRTHRGKSAPKPPERKRPQEKVLRPGLEFITGFKLEAMDFCQNKWYAAKIVQVDEEDQRVLIHFEKWNSRYDEWIDCESERIRPLVRQSTRKETLPQQHPTGEYKYGEEVLARWSDCRYYPAKVLNINKNGTYRMLFYDGIEKNVLATNIRVMPDELKAQKFFSNFTLPPAPPVKGKKRWFAKEENFPAATDQLETSPEPTSPTATTTKRRLSSRPTSPLSPLPVPSKKVKVDEKVKSPKETKAPKAKVEASPASTEPPTKNQATTQDAGVPILVDPKPVLKPVLSSAKMEELISRNIKEPLLAPKELVIDLDHNKYKCDVKGCDKSFRKSTLLEYHKKYYHVSKTSTSRTASRVLHRTRKRISGSRSDSRSRRRSKGIRQKRLSAPADLVSSISSRRADRSLVKRGVVSPGAVPAKESPTSPLGDRRSSRIRHHSAPLQAQVPETRIQPKPPEKAAPEKAAPEKAVPEKAAPEKMTSNPKTAVPETSLESSRTIKVASNSAEVVSKKQEEDVSKTVPKEVEMKPPSIQKERCQLENKKPDEATPSLRSALETREVSTERLEEKEVPLIREMKSIMKNVSMLQEEIRKEEERHRHRRKHKKNKDRKRRKKKKKDKEKKRRAKGKDKTGAEASDDDSDTEEEEEQRREERKLPLNDDIPSRALFKQPSQVTEVRNQPTATYKSLVGVDDDVVKCICKNTREEGFMIQCEICNCWQHSTCVGLNDKAVPKTYACFYCHVSRGAMPPLYDSEAYEWFESGSLPRFPNFGKERTHPQEKWAKSFRLTTNSLIADLLMLAEVLQSLQHKISILQNPEHPEAKLWAKDWILRSRNKAVSSLADSGMSDDLASTLKEMFSLGKLLQQGEGSHLGEGSERSGFAPGRVGPNIEEGDAVSASRDDNLKNEARKGSGVPVEQMEVTDGSGEDGVSAGRVKGLKEVSANMEPSTSVGSALVDTGDGQGNQSTPSGGEVVPVPSKDDRNEEIGSPQVPIATSQSQSPLSVSASQESSGVISKVGTMVASGSNLDGAEGTETKQIKDSPCDTLDVAAGGKSGIVSQEKDEVGKLVESMVSPQTGRAPNEDTVAGSTDENVQPSEPSENSQQEVKTTDSSKISNLASIKDTPTVSSVATSTSVLKRELPSTEHDAGSSNCKQEMSLLSSSDKSVGQKEVSGADDSPATDRSDPSPVEIPHSQETESSKPVQTVPPVEGQNVPNVSSTKILISDKSLTSVTSDSSGEEKIVKCDDSVEVVAGSDDIENPSQAESSGDTQENASKNMVLNVEDVIRRQMNKDNPGPSRAVESEVERNEMSSTAAPDPEETEVQVGEAMDVDDTSSQDKDAESSGEPAARSAAVAGGEAMEDVSVDLSQAYLLRHINTLHNQLSERLDLIEADVEKLENMFFSTASEWQAITQDQSLMKKKMRVLLGDLQKINTIVSL